MENRSSTSFNVINAAARHTRFTPLPSSSSGLILYVFECTRPCITSCLLSTRGRIPGEKCTRFRINVSSLNNDQKVESFKQNCANCDVMCDNNKFSTERTSRKENRNIEANSLIWFFHNRDWRKDIPHTTMWSSYITNSHPSFRSND